MSRGILTSGRKLPTLDQWSVPEIDVDVVIYRAEFMADIVMVLIGDIRYDGRVRKEISTLIKAGHRVELVVSDFAKNAHGDTELGIKIHKVPMTRKSHPALNFVAQIQFNRTAASIVGKLAPTHVHCHDLNTLLAGVWAKKKTKAKLIFDAHELMPESMGGIRQAVWERIERRCVHHCDHIIMPEKNRIEYFKQKYPKIGDVILLENFPRKKDIPNEKYDLFREIYPISEDQKIILHTGLIAAKRHVEDLIESMSLCGDQFVLVLIGMTFRGYEDIMWTKIKKFGLHGRIFVHDPVPHSGILAYMASCDVGTAFYQNTNVNNFYCASNKLYEYIALNKVVLTNDYPGLLDSVGKYRQGVCLADITPRHLAEAYLRANDAAYVTPGVNKYFWEDEELNLLQIYEKSNK
jgi:glycosyltransferase involved in cell wall biosynthesis